MYCHLVYNHFVYFPIGLFPYGLHPARLLSKWSNNHRDANFFATWRVRGYSVWFENRARTSCVRAFSDPHNA